jgi:hypothetical protein
MQSLAFQSSNILENLYTDGMFSYIMTPTISNMPQQFQNIITYCNTYIATWKPTYNDPRNRIVYNQEFMFELLFYKNLILAIPLYLSSTGGKFDSAIAHIKSYCHKLTSSEDGFDVSLAKLLDYKFIFYSPIVIPGHFNLFKTNKTAIKTNLHMEMYQSVPITLNNTPIIGNGTTTGTGNGTIPVVASVPTYENMMSNTTLSINPLNQLYIPYQNYPLPFTNYNKPVNSSGITPMDTK